MRKIFNPLLVAILCVSSVSAQDLRFIFDASKKPAKKEVSIIQYVAEPVVGLGLGIASARILMPRIDRVAFGPSGHVPGLAIFFGMVYGGSAGLAASVNNSLWLRERAGAWGVPLSVAACTAITIPINMIIGRTWNPLRNPALRGFTVAAAIGAAVGAGAVEIARRTQGQ